MSKTVRVLLSMACAAIFSAGLPNTGRAQLDVLPGWDLLTTLPGTEFNGIPLRGWPLSWPVNTFDFGPPHGVQVLDPRVDTIIQRQATATVPNPGDVATIPIELVALHLRTVGQVDLGLGLDYYFVTLQKERGGPPSPGTMDITFASAAGGTFRTSLLDVFFDIRKGGLSGPIALSGQEQFTALGGWQRDPRGQLIDGINHNLNGQDESEDFHLTGAVTHTAPNPPSIHIVDEVPEPSSLALMGVGLLAAGGWRLRRQKHR